MSVVQIVLLTLGALSSVACDGSTVSEGRRTDAGRHETRPEKASDGGAAEDGGRGPLVDARADESDGPGPDASPSLDGSSRDGSAARNRDSGERDGNADDLGPLFLRVPGWSVRKRVRSASFDDVVLEEVLAGFSDAAPGATRVRRLPSPHASERSWSAPAGGYISDFCRHPSGAFSAVLVRTDRTVSIVRFSADLTPLAAARIHDPDIAGDPHVVTDAGVADLFANGFAWDSARIASVGEDVVATVASSWNSIIAYRTTFVNGAWSDPRRTLIEPPVGLTPFLPIGGSFDTFGAIVAWFRSMLDVDEDGNAYVAAWASPARIRAHAAAFGDGLKPLPGDPLAPDSDVILTKMDRGGARVWSRVVGTSHEDEPYALRARFGVAAVAGRARRFPGFDNTIWDAFVSIVSTAGDVIGTRSVSLDASGIFLSVDVLPSGTLVLGGSDGWSQNPDGLSVLSFGNKLLVELPAVDGAAVRLPLPVGPRHNEIRALVADPAHVWFGGHEDGPVMHTGDSDPSLIRATGVVGVMGPRAERD